MGLGPQHVVAAKVSPEVLKAFLGECGLGRWWVNMAVGRGVRVGPQHVVVAKGAPEVRKVFRGGCVG